MFAKFKKKYIADKEFYIYAIGIVVPMIIQNLITNFVSMLDNIMVGQIGTMQMSGVSIINQFMFVFNLTIFGAVSGASIFGTQFLGKGDHEGQKYTMRFRLLLVIITTVLALLLFLVFGKELISLFLSSNNSIMVEQTLKYGEDYLGIMLWSLLPFAIGQAYASAERECGETKIPMYGSIAAIGINLILDYALIFGKFGLPEMGVKGAAIATVVAKVIEAFVVIMWAHLNPEKNRYINKVYRGFYIPGKLMSQMILKGCPLLFNEFIWAFGMSVIAQCYSIRGLDVVAARNIASTISNLFSVVYIQFGASIGIIVGAKLGTGDLAAARDTDNKLIAFDLLVTVVVMLAMLPVAKVFPMMYNTEESIKDMAAFFIIIQALVMPIWSYTNVCYFTIRSGGKTGITFLYDFVYTWTIMIPLAFILANFTNMDIHPLFAIVTFSEIIKAVVGYIMIKSDMWMNNLTEV